MDREVAGFMSVDISSWFTGATYRVIGTHETLVLPNSCVKQRSAVAPWWYVWRKVNGFFLRTRKTVSISSRYLVR